MDDITISNWGRHKGLIDTRKVLCVAVESALGLIWIWSGLIHLSNPFAFVEAIEGYQLSSGPVSVAVAMILPWLQLVLGMCLLSGIFRTGARWCSAGLFQTLTALQFVTLLRGIETSCGCFGEASEEISTFSIVVTQAMALFSLFVIMLDNRNGGSSL